MPKKRFAQGTGRLYIVESMMNQYQCNKSEQRLISQLKDLFPNGDIIIMHDGALCHKAKSLTKFLHEKNIEAFSRPDMNPTNIFWAIAVKKLRKCNIANKNGRIEKLIQIWHRGNKLQSNYQKLKLNMPRRIKSLIKNKKKHTK